MSRQLPAVIWREIFNLYVEDDAYLPEEQHFEWHGARPIALAMVCKEWRHIVMSHHSTHLWSSLYICSEQDVSATATRIQHYIAHSNARLEVICISARSAFPDNFITRIGSMIRNIPKVGKIECLVGMGVKDSLHKLLKLSPQSHALILKGIIPEDDPSKEPYVRLPRHLVCSIKEISADSCGFSWNQSITSDFKPKKVEIMSTHRYPLFNAQNQPPMIQDWAPGALQTLTSYKVDETYSPDLGVSCLSRQGLPSLSVLSTLEIPLGLLLQIHYRHVKLPALRNLIIMNTVNAKLEDWQDFVAAEGGGGKIHNLTIRSMPRSQASILEPFINELPGLTTLTLEGESVARITRRMLVASEFYQERSDSHSPYPSLSTLRVRNYTGEGRSLAKFLHLRGWLAASSDHITIRCRLHLINCGHLSPDVNAIILPYCH